MLGKEQNSERISNNENDKEVIEKDFNKITKKF